AASVLEAVSGAPFAEFVQMAVLEPLQLRRTTFDPAAILAADDRALGHVEGYDSVPPITPMLAAGGAYATAHDLARLAVLHLNRGRVGDEQFLPISLLNQMHAIHRPYPGQTQGY